MAFAQQQTGNEPCQLDFGDLDAPLIGAFLNHLEQDRGNSRKTRNARLAAIHSLHRYAALRHPEHAATIARVIEIPTKRHPRTMISYLDRTEIDALLKAPDRATWLGRRDHAMLLTAIQTGVRVSELVNLTIASLTLGTGAHLRVLGKGRKERSAVLTRETVTILDPWLRERKGAPPEPLFPTRHGDRRARDRRRR
ncbi:MAG TPA: tyrosine-type recombinase/integrase [Solirubrobacteraceae bacterium]